MQQEELYSRKQMSKKKDYSKLTAHHEERLKVPFYSTYETVDHQDRKQQFCQKWTVFFPVQVEEHLHSNISRHFFIFKRKYSMICCTGHVYNISVKI